LKTFVQALCHNIGRAAAVYLQVVLKYCLYPRPHSLYRLFAPFVAAANVKLLEEAGMATTKDQLNELLRGYRYDLQLPGGL